MSEQFTPTQWSMGYGKRGKVTFKGDANKRYAWIIVDEGDQVTELGLNVDQLQEFIWLAVATYERLLVPTERRSGRWR